MPHPRWQELQEFVDVGNLDGVRALATLDDIAVAWCDYHQTKADEDWWAVELFMTSQIFHDPTFHRAALLALAERAPDDLALSVVGAGPLEDFVGPDEESLQWIEESARRSTKLRQALANVWIWDQPRSVFERVEQAAGVPLARPRGRESQP